VPVLVLSVHPAEQYAVRVLRAGASGYLTKESAPEELLTAIRRIVRGGRYISPSVGETLADDLGRPAAELPHHGLSDREFEIMRLLASGKRASEIAEHLHRPHDPGRRGSRTGIRRPGTRAALRLPAAERRPARR